MCVRACCALCIKFVESAKTKHCYSIYILYVWMCIQIFNQVNFQMIICLHRRWYYQFNRKGKHIHSPPWYTRPIEVNSKIDLRFMCFTSWCTNENAFNMLNKRCWWSINKCKLIWWNEQWMNERSKFFLFKTWCIAWKCVCVWRGVWLSAYRHFNTYKQTHYTFDTLVIFYSYVYMRCTCAWVILEYFLMYVY